MIVVSCAPPVTPLAQRSELVIGIAGGLDNVLQDPRAAAVAALVSESLVRRTATEELEPRLVEAVPRLGDGAVIDASDGDRITATFRIRPDARWHDGTPVRATDVRFAFEEDRRAPEGDLRRMVAERIERIEVIDELTVRVVYRAGERWDAFALAPRALPAHLLVNDDARATYSVLPLHAGPYRVERRSGSTLSLVPFEDHPLDRPAIDRIVVRAFADRTALLSALGRGIVDVVPSPALDADLARSLDRSGGSTSVAIYTPAQAVAVLRLGPLFAEPEVGDALRQAIDRRRIARSVFAGRVRVTSSYLVAPLWAAAELGEPPPPDRDAARRDLGRAGYRLGAFGVTSREGTPLGGTILVPRGETALEDVARSIAADLSALGLAVNVGALDAADLERRVAAREFDLALLTERNDDPLLATRRYRGLMTPWGDVLADAAVAGAGRSEQRPVYEELQRLWAADADAISLYQVLKVDVVPARLQGVRPAAHGAPVTWNAGSWRLAPP